VSRSHKIRAFSWAFLLRRFRWHGFIDATLKAPSTQLGLTREKDKIYLQWASSLCSGKRSSADNPERVLPPNVMIPFLQTASNPDRVIHAWINSKPCLAVGAFIPFLVFGGFWKVSARRPPVNLNGRVALAIGCTVIAAGRPGRFWTYAASNFRLGPPTGTFNTNPQVATDVFVRCACRRVRWGFSLVQRASRGDFHGLCGFPSHWAEPWA